MFYAQMRIVRLRRGIYYHYRVQHLVYWMGVLPIWRNFKKLGKPLDFESLMIAQAFMAEKKRQYEVDGFAFGMGFSGWVTMVSLFPGVRTLDEVQRIEKENAPGMHPVQPEKDV